MYTWTDRLRVVLLNTLSIVLIFAFCEGATHLFLSYNTPFQDRPGYHLQHQPSGYIRYFLSPIRSCTVSVMARLRMIRSAIESTAMDTEAKTFRFRKNRAKYVLSFWVDRMCLTCMPMIMSNGRVFHG
jgi:hypothetical protein